jgi:hypothetical protein
MSPKVIVSILVRRLREGKTYEDFRKAWLPDKGFGVPTRVVSAIRTDDPREIVTVGFTDISEDEASAFLDRVGPQEQVRHDRIEEVIEPGGTRAFYVLVADDDLTSDPPSS